MVFWNHYVFICITTVNGAGSISSDTLVEGNIDFNYFKQALRILFDRHPMLRATTYLDNDYYYFDFNASFEQIEIVNIHSDDDTQIHKIFFEESVKPFESNKGLWRAFLVTRNEKLHNIILGYSHTISDGLSIVNLTGELLKIIKNLTQNINSTYENLEFPPPDAMENLIRQKFAKNNSYDNSDTKSDTEEIDPNCFESVYSSDLNIESNGYIHTISEKKLKKILHACRSNRTTLNALINVSFAMALKNLKGQQQATFDIINAANARPFSDIPLKEENMGNYVIAAATDISIDKNIDIWDKCRSFNINFRENLKEIDIPEDPNTQLLDGILGGINELLNNQTTLFKYGVSNIGRVDQFFLDLDKNYSIKNSRVQICNSVPHLGVYLLITTLNNTMDIVFNYATPLISSSWIKTLAIMMEENMLA